MVDRALVALDEGAESFGIPAYGRSDQAAVVGLRLAFGVQRRRLDERMCHTRTYAAARSEVSERSRAARRETDSPLDRIWSARPDARAGEQESAVHIVLSRSRDR